MNLKLSVPSSLSLVVREVGMKRLGRIKVEKSFFLCACMDGAKGSPYRSEVVVLIF